MTTVWLSGLVGLGLFLLVGIALWAHRMEVAKIERVRLAGLHRDRFRNLQFVLDVLPNQAIPGQLPALLTRNMVLHIQKVIELQGETPEAMHHLAHSEKLQQITARGERLKNKPPRGTLQDRLKDTRRAIKILKEFILQQHRAGFLSKPVASQFIRSLQEIGIVATVDGLLSQASHSLAEGSKSTALRYYQMSLQEIRKCKTPELLDDQKKQVTTAITRLKADQRALQNATQEVNKQLARSISKEDKSGDDDEFDMRQIN